jgi:hypothetical protein
VGNGLHLDQDVRVGKLMDRHRRAGRARRVEEIPEDLG